MLIILFLSQIYYSDEGKIDIKKPSVKAAKNHLITEDGLLSVVPPQFAAALQLCSLIEHNYVALHGKAPAR